MNPDEYECESGITAPQTRNYSLLGHVSIKISNLLPFSLYEAPNATIVWPFRGENDGLGGVGREGHGPFGLLDPTVRAIRRFFR